MLEFIIFTIVMILSVVAFITLLFLFAPLIVYLFEKPIVLYSKLIEKYWIWISVKLKL